MTIIQSVLDKLTIEKDTLLTQLGTELNLRTAKRLQLIIVDIDNNIRMLQDHLRETKKQEQQKYQQTLYTKDVP